MFPLELRVITLLPQALFKISLSSFQLQFLSPEDISFPTALSKVIVSSPASLAILSVAEPGGRTSPLVPKDGANHCPFSLPNFHPLQTLKLCVQTIPPLAADFRLQVIFLYLKDVSSWSTLTFSKAAPVKILHNFLVHINDSVMDFQLLTPLSSKKHVFHMFALHGYLTFLFN